MVGQRSADKSADVISENWLIGARLKGNRSADCTVSDFLNKLVRIVLNVIASVGRQIDVYRPIKIQKSYRPTVFLNVIPAYRENN